jgi:hypothetical protein
MKDRRVILIRPQEIKPVIPNDFLHLATKAVEEFKIWNKRGI